MAISTPTNVAAVTGGSVSNASTYDTAATILTAGRLYRLTVVTYKASTPAIPTTVTQDPLGTPLSFTLDTAGGTNASVVSWDSAAHRSLSVWKVVPGATTANALIRITGMGSCSACGWSLTEISSGFNATTPTAQVNVASGLQTSAIAVTMGAFADSGNLTTLVMGWGDGTANPAETVVATESRTELEEHNDGERCSLGSDYQNPNGGDTSIGATLSASTVDWACIGIETAILAPFVGTDTDAGTLSDNRSLGAPVAAADQATLTEATGSITAAWIDTDQGILTEVAASALQQTQTASDTDSLTVTETAGNITAQATQTDVGVLADSAALGIPTATVDQATLADVSSSNIAPVDADQGALAELSGLTSQVIGPDTGTLTETESASQAATGGGPATDTESATLAESRAATLEATSAEAAILAESTGGVAAAFVDTDQAILTETSSGTGDLVGTDAVTFAETESASQLSPGVGVDTDGATLVEQAIGELLASISDSGTAVETAFLEGFPASADSAAFSDTHAGLADLVTADVGAFSESELATVPQPILVETDAFTFGDDAVVSYRFPPPNRGTRLMRHGQGTWLHVR